MGLVYRLGLKDKSFWLLSEKFSPVFQAKLDEIDNFK
jgi:hypothetical protein